MTQVYSLLKYGPVIYITAMHGLATTFFNAQETSVMDILHHGEGSRVCRTLTN